MPRFHSVALRFAPPPSLQQLIDEKPAAFVASPPSNVNANSGLSFAESCRMIHPHGQYAAFSTSNSDPASTPGRVTARHRLPSFVVDIARSADSCRRRPAWSSGYGHPPETVCTRAQSLRALSHRLDSVRCTCPKATSLCGESYSSCVPRIVAKWATGNSRVHDSHPYWSVVPALRTGQDVINRGNRLLVHSVLLYRDPFLWFAHRSPCYAASMV